jgi:hypothetical protein
MVVLPMQSIGGNNDGTYTLYMFPLMPRALGLACRPCSGPWQLKFGEYYFSTSSFQVFWGLYFISQALDLVFLRALEWDYALGS